ncbi:MAG: hypothetical protein L0323_19285 [Planctomycetes bacterium]|nr:hypothetical protein [Planctomycetota bacterium]
MSRGDPIPLEEILRAVEKVLARGEFNPPAWKVWIRERILEPIGVALEELLRVLARTGGGWTTYLLLGLLVAGAAALLVLLVSSLLRGAESVRRTEALERVTSGRRGGFDVAALEGQAQAAAAAGRFPEAVRLLYLATLLRLRAREEEDLDLSRTPGEHLAGFRRAPYFPRLREFVAAYQSSSFGGRSLDREGWARFAALRPAEARP